MFAFLVAAIASRATQPCTYRRIGTRQAAGFLALFKLALGSGDVSLLLLLAGIFGGCCEVAVAAPPSRPDDERCGGEDGALCRGRG